MVQEMEDLSGKTAIITGAGQGMGRSVAHALATRGARLVINDLNPESARKTAADLTAMGSDAVAIPGNVVNRDVVQQMVTTTMDTFGSVDILVNSAGVLYPTKVKDIAESEWDLVIDVNMKGTFLCSQSVLKPMTAGGWGRIINFSSTAGKNVSTVGGAHYTAAKAGILGFTRHLAKEVASDGITVNAICPGLFDTEMVRTTISDSGIRKYEKSFPISRLGQPEEVAELVAFIVSDRAAYITGASLDINGGDLMI